MFKLERQTFLASCTVSAHYALLLYSLISKAADYLLNCMVFLFGIASILLFSSSKYAYESRTVFLSILVTGITTFKASVVIATVTKVFVTIFRWAVGMAFCIGGLNSLRVKKEKDYAIHNAIYITLNAFLNIIYDLFC